MNVSIGDHWETFVAELVKSGRYGSASEVVRTGLRMVEERESRLKWLRDKVQASLSDGGELDTADLDAALDRTERELASEGY